MEMDKLSSFGCWVGHFPFTYLCIFWRSFQVWRNFGTRLKEHLRGDWFPRRNNTF